MNILVALPAYRYGDPRSIEPHYDWFVQVPRTMGHRVRLFNTARWHAVDLEALEDELLRAVREHAFDLVLLLTDGTLPRPDVLSEVRKSSFLVAFNSDDDWRWEDHTSKLSEHFDCMVTTYRHVWEANRSSHPNLLLSQWACLGAHDGLETPKDLPVSFVGLNYGDRARQVAHLRKAAPVIAYGSGFGGAEGDDGGLRWKARRRVAAALRLPLNEQPLSFEQINAIWNRTRISFTPLEASRPGHVQVKSRVFDMGLSGTMMLCTRNPMLDEFYERGREYEDYADLNEACDKIRHYLANEGSRSRIAAAYHERTKREHLWEHRWQDLLARFPLPARARNQA